MGASAGRPAGATERPVRASDSVGRLGLDEAGTDDEPSLAEIEFRARFQDHCAKCHKKRYEPGHFTDKQWRDFLPRHARKTRVNEQAAEQILQWMVDHN